MSWPWNPCQRSLKVFDRGTIRYIGHGFLLVFYRNIVPKMHRFWDNWLQKCRDLENWVTGPSRSLERKCHHVLPFISKTVRDRPIVTMKHYNRSVRGQNFPADLYYYARTIWPRITEFGMVTMGEIWDRQGHEAAQWSTRTLGLYVAMMMIIFLGVSHVAIPRGAASPFWDHCMRSPTWFDLERRNLVW